MTISKAVYDIWENYDWPGNIRELQNCIESCVIMCPGAVLTPHDLPAGFRSAAAGAVQMSVSPHRPCGTLREESERFERELIRAVLEQCGGNREAAMKKLNISKRTFYGR